LEDDPEPRPRGDAGSSTGVVVPESSGGCGAAGAGESFLGLLALAALRRRR